MITELRYSNTNTYLIEGRNGSLLFDTGWAGTFPDLCRELGRRNMQLQDIDALLISHFHPDHMGIAQEIADHGPKIVILDTQKSFLHNADSVFEKDPGKKFVPIRDEEVRVIKEEESQGFLKEFGLSGGIFSTPGHSADSISLWLDEGIVFVGDLNPLYELELHKGTEIGNSWEKILSYRPKAACYGHAKSAHLIWKDETHWKFSEASEILRSEEKEEKAGADRKDKDLFELVNRILKLIGKGYPLNKIEKKTGADPVFIEDVSRMYLTHPGIGVQGILDRIEIKGK